MKSLIQKYNIRKVLNNGEHVKRKAIITFMTERGNRTPKEIWIGEDDFGIELHSITRKGLIKDIEFNNKFFKDNPELLKHRGGI